METSGTWAHRLRPPLAAFLGATAVVVVCAIGAGFNPLEGDTWTRWDSYHYVNIALYGYSQGPLDCSLTGPLACKHAGWFPGYSALFALPGRVFGATPSGVATAWLFTLATLILLWGRLLAQGVSEARAGLLFATAVPGMIYLHAIFPMSVLTFFALLCLLLLSERRFALAGLSGAAAAAAYPLGVLLAPIAGVWALVAGAGSPPWRRIGLALAAAAPVVAGFAAVMLYQRLELGEWFLYFEAQEHPLRTPLSGIQEEVRRSRDGNWLALAAGAQALFTTAVAIAVAVLLVRRRTTLSPLDWLVGIWVLGVWALPLSQTGVSVYRSNAALLPAALLLRHFSPPLRWAFVAGSLVLAAPMCVLFFNSTLV